MLQCSPAWLFIFVRAHTAATHVVEHEQRVLARISDV